MAPPAATTAASCTAPSRGDLFLGFVAFNLLTFVTVGFCVGILVGATYYPRQVCLYFVLPYYSFILLIDSVQLRDGRRWEWFTRYFFIMKLCRRFLGISVVVPESIKKTSEDAQYIFAVFPHGANADFRILLDGMLYDCLPRKVAATTRTLAATVLFRIPIIREIALWTGCVDARKSVAEKLLSSSQRSLLVLPGGQAEQMRTQHGREIVYLKSRKGFLKLALKHNVPVVPIYVFGASDYYQTSKLGMGTRLWLLKNLGIALPLAWGYFGSILCPRPVPTTVVFGEPLCFKIKESGSPSADELDRAHIEFMDALQKLFDAHKDGLGYGSRKLEIH